jgi:serine/threonine protein kinase
MLNYNPKKRITAPEALRHPWFNENPLPCKQEEMPVFQELYDKERQLLKKNRKRSLDESQRQQREKLYDVEKEYDYEVDGEYVKQLVNTNNIENNENKV